MSEPTTTAEIAAAIAPTPVAPVLQPVSVPVPGTEAAKPDSATKPPAAAGDPPKEATADDAAKDDVRDDKPKNSAQQRISELYGQKKTAEREAIRNAQEVARLRLQLQEIQQSVDPNDYEARQHADLRSAVKIERMQQLESEVRARHGDSVELRALGFQAKVEAARDRIPDVDTVLADFSRVPLSEVGADILSESDKAVEIAYYLTKNPQEAHRIAQMPEHRQAYELARIESKVSIAQPRRNSNAPAPVPMIGASSAPSTPAVADMGVEDIAKQLYGGRRN